MTTIVASRPEESDAYRRLAPARAAFRTVMVHVGPEACDQPRLESAASIAKLLDATLFGVAAETPPRVSFVDPVGGTDSFWLVECQKQIEEDFRQAEALFRARAAGLRTQWKSIVSEPIAAMTEQARIADLIIADAGARTNTSRYSSCNPAELVLLSGRPVLLAPPSGAGLVAEVVVVAWKDTREARRALADALPFLQSAREVVVVEIAEHGPAGVAESSTKVVAQGLGRHGVSARAMTMAGSTDDVAGLLEGAARRAGADLIVAGCYGRSQLREWFFGGATRGLLQVNDRFVLMSH